MMDWGNLKQHLGLSFMGVPDWYMVAVLCSRSFDQGMLGLQN